MWITHEKKRTDVLVRNNEIRNLSKKERKKIDF